MTTEQDSPTYREQRFRKKEQMPKKYRASYRLTDEATGQVAAHCDLIGKAMFVGLDIYDAEQAPWQLRANRRIMPTRWSLHPPSGQVVLRFDQKTLGKLNPLYRVALAVLDADGKERYRLIDPRTSIPDRLFGTPIGDWNLLEGEQPVAKITALPTQEPKKPAKGLLGKLKNFFNSSDRGFVSMGDEHLLPAPAVLALLLLFDEITDTSGAD